MFRFVAVLFFCLELAFIHADNHQLCAGNFVDKNTSISHLQQNSTHLASALMNAIRGPSKNGHIINFICPLQSLERHSSAGMCHQKIARREFNVKDHEQCRHFTPHGFLTLLQNRNLYIMGDSTVHQFFSSLLCAILVTNVEANWFHDETACIERKVHCALGTREDAKIEFKEYNASISMVAVTTYREPVSIQDILLREKVKTNDIVYFSYGVWYNDAKEFANNTDRFLSDYTNYIHNVSNADKLPVFYFQEAMPQHFPRIDVKNGYWEKQYADNWCEDLKDLDLAHKFDWRNRIIEQKLTETETGIIQIKIADTMRTQFDAHLDTEVYLADCTHWCHPGAIMNYMHRMLYNVIRTDPRTAAYVASQPKRSTYNAAAGDNRRHE